MDFNKSQLNINHLKMICQLEKHETVKEAAQALFITQPALTNRIREAERRLNSKLFIRRGRKLAMSNAGKRLLYSAKKILEELSRAEYDISRLSDGVEQVLRVGLPHYATFNWLPNAVTSFSGKFKNIELELSAESAIKPLNALYNGAIDIAIIASAQKELNVDEGNFQSILLFKDELLACLSTEHKKAGNKFLDATDFSEETYVTNSTVPETDREYELFFKPANIIPRKVLQVGFNEAIIELIKANMGISIFSKQQIALLAKTESITTVSLGDQGLNLYWHLVCVNQDSITKPAYHLAKVIRQKNNAT